MSRCRGFSPVLVAAAGGLLLWCGVPARAQKLPKRCLPHPADTHIPKVSIDQVKLDGTELPPGLTQEQLVASIQASVLNAGSDWVVQVTRAVKEAWQDAGYLQAVATVKPRFTGASAGGRHVELTVQVDPGPRYRLGRLRIRTTDPGGKLVFSEEDLRKMIPLRYGEILDAGKLRQGLKEMQEFYGARGYIDMTATPGFHIHQGPARVSIYIFVDQRKQYRVRKMTVLGLSASLKGLLESKLAPGDIFNWNRVLDFYQTQQPVLPPHASPRDDEVYRVPNTGKVDVWLDFRACPQPGQANPGAAADTGLH
jgi:hypothetical protein